MVHAPTQESHQAWQVTCSEKMPECGFSLRDNDKEELVNLVKQHAKAAHDLQISEADVWAMAKPTKY